MTSPPSTQEDTGPIRNVCENCGSGIWIHATPEKTKAALTRVVLGSPRMSFFPSAGTPVDIYICENCYNVRLFAIPIQ